MAVYFLDTSALVKRYVAETGSAWVTALCDPAAGHIIVISQAALVEAVATLCRKAHDGTISPHDRDRLIAVFHRDVRRSYSLERVTTAVYIRAGDLCRIHRLRAYDAVQLACAVTLRDKSVALGVSPLFASADTALLSFAAAEGLATDNPGSHP
jgi:predicted nucleic acid-binding protein